MGLKPSLLDTIYHYEADSCNEYPSTINIYKKVYKYFSW